MVRLKQRACMHPCFYRPLDLEVFLFIFLYKNYILYKNFYIKCNFLNILASYRSALTAKAENAHAF